MQTTGYGIEGKIHKLVGPTFSTIFSYVFIEREKTFRNILLYFNQSRKKQKKTLQWPRYCLGQQPSDDLHPAGLFIEASYFNMKEADWKGTLFLKAEQK